MKHLDLKLVKFYFFVATQKNSFSGASRRFVQGSRLFDKRKGGQDGKIRKSADGQK